MSSAAFELENAYVSLLKANTLDGAAMGLPVESVTSWVLAGVPSVVQRSPPTDKYRVLLTVPIVVAEDRCCRRTEVREHRGGGLGRRDCPQLVVVVAGLGGIECETIRVFPSAVRVEILLMFGLGMDT